MKVQLSKKSQKDLTELNKATRKRIIDALHNLQEGIPPLDLKKIQGASNCWRLRVGDWRVMIKLEKEIAQVLTVRNRRDSYRNF
ncbi:MAG TPA: type II toxin-antitoxin system RelE/ParE family toxin [Firmicutes bacterium]|jgi:mRNA interferase RelE/StbE|nr:type II toxin-antitoxin system RelE/ParE family toxin [Bacillota bacterium]